MLRSDIGAWKCKLSLGNYDQRNGRTGGAILVVMGEVILKGTFKTMNLTIVYVLFCYNNHKFLV